MLQKYVYPTLITLVIVMVALAIHDKWVANSKIIKG